MDMDAIVDKVVRACTNSRHRFGQSSPVAEIKQLLIALNIGVLDVVADRAGDDIDLRVVFDGGWEPLDEQWTSADSLAAMFNALEVGGFRHVPGTASFDDDYTIFVKDELKFIFARPQIPISS